MRPFAPLPSTFVPRAFSVREALEAGLSRDRLASRDVPRPFHGARSTLSPLAPDATPQRAALRRLEEYRPLLTPEQFFSSVSAAVYWGLPLPWPLYDGPVHVATKWPARAPRVTGTVGHALRRPRVVRRDGWCVQAPADAWCELAAFLSLDELVAAGDALFYRQRKLTTRDRLAQAIRNWGAKPGALKLRAAFDLIRENAESPKETEWRLILDRAGFPEPVVNFEVYGPGGELIAIIDLAYPWAMTGLDYDGRHHAENPRQFARDGKRSNALLRAGWHDIKIMAGMTEAEVLADLGEQLFKKGWRPGASPARSPGRAATPPAPAPITRSSQTRPNHLNKPEK